MSSKLSYSESRTQTDTFVRSDYPISIMDRLSRIRWNADPNRSRWIRDHIEASTGVSSVEQRKMEKRGGGRNKESLISDGVVEEVNIPEIKLRPIYI